jgi:CTP:molybdopterin cytidylyltransferase MocA
MWLLKKADMDIDDVLLANFEAVKVAGTSLQFATDLKENKLLLKFQSAYMLHHSMETAVLMLLRDILLALEMGRLAVLYETQSV